MSLPRRNPETMTIGYEPTVLSDFDTHQTVKRKRKLCAGNPARANLHTALKIRGHCENGLVGIITIAQPQMSLMRMAEVWRKMNIICHIVILAQDFMRGYLERAVH